MGNQADPYAAIAGHWPNDVSLGGTFITMMQPEPGFESAYNRWYEDDHFYSGAMVGPWIFAGRRWVATRDLQRLRFPENSPIAQPVTAGPYITTYFTLAGHHEDALNWGTTAMTQHLLPNGRGFTQRASVYTITATLDFAVIRTDLTALKPHHMLNHPFVGLVVEVYEPDPSADRAEVVRSLEELLQADVENSPVAAALAFTSRAYAGGDPSPGVSATPPGAGVSLTVLNFLQADPRTCWSRFRERTSRAEAAGAQIVFSAPFVPTVPGTDLYVDEIT
jgi:hypothetical protein